MQNLESYPRSTEVGASAGPVGYALTGRGPVLQERTHVGRVCIQEPYWVLAQVRAADVGGSVGSDA